MRARAVPDGQRSFLGVHWVAKMRESGPGLWPRERPEGKLQGMSVSLDEIARTLAEREGRERRAAEERAAQLRARMPAAATLLRERFFVETISLFGSLATGEVGPRSDVDIAVSHLRPERYWEALAELRALFGAPVDLVRDEEMGASLRERVAVEGIAH